MFSWGERGRCNVIWRRLVMLGVGVAVSAGALAEGMADVTFYGRLKWDAAVNSTEVAPAKPGNYSWWVIDDVLTTERGRSASSVRASRLGVKFSQGEELTGRAEVDFQGTPEYPDPASGQYEFGTTRPELEPTVMLRHAYLNYKFNDDCSILFGQTDDVFAPLLPGTLNYGDGNYCGNVGYRRNQVRFEYTKGPIVGQVAYARDVQGRVAFQLKDEMDETKPPTLAVGVSGLSGERDRGSATTTPTIFDISGVAVDAQIALGSRLTVRAEYHWGTNLSEHNGAIGQGLVPKPVGAPLGFSKEIESQGGWVQLGLKLTDKITVNVGRMEDNPEDADLSGIPDLEELGKNSCAFGNIMLTLSDSTQVGIEVSGMETHYLSTGPTAVPRHYHNTRFQFSLIYEF